MTDYQILESPTDRSINVVVPVTKGGYFETRSVQRDRDTLIIYLSSMSGCDRACRFCHLTQTGQTSMNPLRLRDYVDNAKVIFGILEKKGNLEDVEKVHFNFMARGDALSNPHFVQDYNVLFSSLRNLSQRFIPDVYPKFKISTIFPTEISNLDGPVDLKKFVDDVLKDPHDVEFYYSLYSLDQNFRKRWIPKALDPEMVGAAFHGRESGLRIHHALISEENTSTADVVEIGDWLERHKIRTRMNVVRYNSFSDACGVEASDETIETYLQMMRDDPRIQDTQVIPRVCTTVKAACGLFVDA